jgi:protein-tyrosine phosphatase
MVVGSVIDLHCHVLPGIDDGPATIEQSVELARAAAQAGISRLVATPHVNATYGTDAATIAALVGQLNAKLREEGVDLEVLPGAEVALTHIAELAPEQLALLGLGGSGWLLLEPPFAPVAPGLEDLVLAVCREGWHVVLAHPERCPALHRDRAAIESLAAHGVLMSVTAGSLTGQFGSEVKRFTLGLARDGLIHNVTSDAHDTERRPPGLTDAIERSGLAALGDWLTRDVPTAILSDAAIPPRPVRAAIASAEPRRRPRWSLRR